MSVASVGSAILKPGSISVWCILLFIISRQNECIVVILALPNNTSCFFKCSEGFFEIALVNAPAILSLISEAAAFVKVTIKSLSISIGFFSSISLFIILSTKTAVLPDPAAAATNKLVPLL